jgi:VanZ like family
VPGAQISDRTWHSRGCPIACWSSVVLALIGLTLGLHEFVPRYRPLDRQLLENHDFGRDLAEWGTTGRVRPDPRRSGAVVLEVAGAAAGTASLRQAVDLVRTPATVIVRAELAAEIVDPGDGRIGGAWIIVGSLVGSSPASPYWETGAFEPYLVTGSHGWWPLEAALTVPAGSPMLTFEAGVGGGVGSVLRITDLAVLEASERINFRIGRLALMVAWGLTAVWGGAAVYRGLGSGWARLAFAVLLGTAALGLLMPESARPPISLFRADAGAATGHMLLFFFLALAFRLARPQDPSWLSLGLLALLAAASEVLQLFVPARGPELPDLLADFAGILAGLVLCAPARHLYSRILGRNRVR